MTRPEVLDPFASRSTSGAAQEPIAVVGMACRFPQAPNIESFWRLLHHGVDAVSEVPSDRWDTSTLYDPDRSAPGKLNTKWGGFLDQIDRFDPQFFGISPREAIHVDPQQRLMLELSWEALEDAGIVPAALHNTQTGVFFGAMWQDYGRLPNRLATITQHTATGEDLSIIPARVSYSLGLRGPSIALNTACSSSLVAVHYARRSIQQGECSLALAGGVQLMLSAESTVAMSKFGALSPDGRCKAFDLRGNGFVRGEGAGVVVLKPLSQALADGNPVHCIVLGSAVNNDGASDSLSAPSQEAQERVLRAAYADAGANPEEVQYVETHGTGTFLGDPIEASALGAVLGANREATQPLLIGSVKTNIGHLEPASGVAGLIKTILAMKHREVPANLHFQTPNPNIRFHELRLKVPTAPLPWPKGTAPVLAGVSSFGFAGTNCHVVVGEAPSDGNLALPLVARCLEDACSNHSEARAEARAEPMMLPLSSHSQAALLELARSWVEFLERTSEASLSDIVYTASVRRSHLTHRLAVIGRSRSDLITQLQAFLAGGMGAGMSHGIISPGPPRKLAFVFPGQGGQWVAMGKQLLAQEPVFRQAIETCHHFMAAHSQFSLLEVLRGEGPHAELEHVDVIQPAVFAMQVGLSALWRSWGVEPAAVVGHSMGEVAAAYASGWMTLQDACRVICLRSQLVRRVSGQGGMAVAELSVSRAHELLLAYSGTLSIAAINGPRTVVISGLKSALSELLQRLEKEGIFCRWIKVDYASHSPQMDPLKSELLRDLSSVQGLVGHTPLYSTVTGQRLLQPLSPQYWSNNLREPVEFWKSIQALSQDGFDTFLELSPHPVLLPAIEEGLSPTVKTLAVIAAMRRDQGELAGPRLALGSLYVHGYPVDFTKQHPAGGRVVPLPSYPWQRQRFWYESPISQKTPVPPKEGHPLLGPSIQLSNQPGSRLFETLIDGDPPSYLQDHRVQEAVVFPAAAYVEMAWTTAKEFWGSEPCVLENLILHEAMALEQGKSKRVQTVASQQGPSWLRFQVASQEAKDAPWCLHATARLGRTAPQPAQAPSSPSALRTRCKQELTAGSFYTALSNQGLVYGPAFRTVVQVHYGVGESLGRVELPVGLRAEAAAYTMHPALLDGCLQLLVAALYCHAVSGPLVPVRIESIFVHRWPGSSFWGHAQTRRTGPLQPLRVHGDIRLLDETGQLLVEFVGVELRQIELPAKPRTSRYFMHKWQLAGRPAEIPSASHQRILVLADRGGVAWELERWLKEHGAAVSVLRSSAQGTWSLPALEQGRGQSIHASIVYLGSLDQPFGEELCTAAIEQAYRRDTTFVLHLVQALARAGLRDAPRLFIVTRGAHGVDARDRLMSPAGGALWGLGRTITNEHPELRCKRIDLARGPWKDEIAALGSELLGPDHEEEVALRPSGRFVARLAESKAAPDVEKILEPLAGRPYRLVTDTPGILDRLMPSLMARRSPSQGEVEIEVRAAGLNFIDVLLAMGIYPGQEAGSPLLGVECAGVIVAVGDGLAGLAVGDRVLALTRGAFASHVTIPASAVVQLPEGIPFDQAAAVPVVFVTASYALNTLARLKKGERVLIHSAAGGTGLAALHLARRAGAEVFATAGSPEKRAYLRSLGVEHVLDSRSLEFGEEILTITKGGGVDVVLNSLTGAAIATSFSVLAPYGRFIEIGKRDIYDNAPLGLGHFRKKLSYFAVDLAGMINDRPAEIAELLRQVAAELRTGTLTFPPIESFPIAEAERAFRLMAQGGHVGKLVFDFAKPPVDISVAAAGPDGSLRGDSTYLITGGLGGLGLSLAKWLVENGARYLCLMGRQGTDSAEKQSAVAALERAGAQVLVVKADVSSRAAVLAGLQQIRARLPALRGVVHAAGLLDDGLLVQQDADRFAKVMAPKALGAWNLHELTQNEPLDFFVMYSSASALLGLPGQGNYAAANAFLDALAHYRRALGLPALSINWGTFSEVGLAAAQMNRGQRLSERGMKSITPQEGNEEFGRLLQSRQPQLAVWSLNLRQWIEYYPQVAASSLLFELVRQAKEQHAPERGEPKLKEALRTSSPEQRIPLLKKFVREQLGHVLRMQPFAVDEATSFKNFGLDSLLGLEFRNLLESGLGLKLSATLIWTYPDVNRLAAYLHSQLTEPVTPPEEAPRSAVTPQDTKKSTLDDLSDSELARIGQELLE